MFRERLDLLSRPLATEAVWNASRILRYRRTSEVGSILELASRAQGKPAEEVAIELIRQIEKDEQVDFRELTEKQVNYYIDLLGQVIRERSFWELSITDSLGANILDTLRSSTE